MASLRRRVRGLVFNVGNEGDSTRAFSSSSALADPGEGNSGRDTSSQQHQGHHFTGPDEHQDREGSPERPPSYSSYASDSEIFSSDDFRSQSPSPPGMDPLAAAAWHNKTRSLLHRLPDHVLVQIIEMLDNSGVECIRRVARRFPYLCEDIMGHRLRTIGVLEQEQTGPLPWPRFLSMSPAGQAQELLRAAEGLSAMHEDRWQLITLLDRDRYCDECLAAREAPG